MNTEKLCAMTDLLRRFGLSEPTIDKLVEKGWVYAACLVAADKIGERAPDEH